MRLVLYKLYCLASLPLFFCGPVQAASSLNFADPIQFFTNVAPRLLANTFGPSTNVSLGTNFCIQIYPVNYYTPALHRLLQVTANLYDATTNNGHLTTGDPRLPTVFRPVFGVMCTGTNASVYITNYVEETDPSLDVLKPGTFIRDVNDFNPADTNSILNVLPNDNVYGIPLIIGARKGLPNFNEFAGRNAITVTRKLQFTRPAWPAVTPLATNVMYTLSISNVLGIEAWNSYTNPYPRSLQMVAVADVEMALMTTNGTYTSPVPFTLFTNRFLAGFVTNLTASSWTGYPGTNPLFSFQIPLYTNTAFMTNSTYQQNPPGIIPLSGIFESNLPGGAFPVPRWWYYQNTRVRYILLDTSVTPNRIVDYVSLSQAQDPVDVTYQLMGGQQHIPILGIMDGSANAAWATNRNKADKIPSLNLNLNVPTVGIINQILVGNGQLNGAAVDWNSYVASPLAASDKVSAEDYFANNLVGNTNNDTTLTNMFYSPLDPTRTVYQHIDWQANDPLVHYMVGDLVNTNKNDPGFTENAVDFIAKISALDNLTNVNIRYRPWGGNPNTPGAATDYDAAVKDPLVYKSDDWQFPTNGLPGIGWIGQVHRGTPWQTVYLKSAGADTNALYTWTNWTGDLQASDAVSSMPTNDWQLAGLLDVLFNTNDVHHLLSVNNQDTNAWQAVMDGFQVPTIVAQVVTSNSPQAAVIANGINLMRQAGFNGTFKQPGDILSVPELSMASPYLGGINLNSPTNSSVNDAILESIPEQLLPRLRPDSFGSIGEGGLVRFTGVDGYAYATEVSSNLVDWVAVGTNYPAFGNYDFTDPAPDPNRRFYRSVLLP